MNLKDAKNAPVGALVRESYGVVGGATGIILSKEHVVKEHTANVLGQKKKERYDFYVHWFKAPSYRKTNPCKVQSWEVMLLKGGPK
tara:strand:- start:1358 stop:1615 length:258 start_codon:yes stop_codon:yes gene_type:complete